MLRVRYFSSRRPMPCSLGLPCFRRSLDALSALRLCPYKQHYKKMYVRFTSASWSTQNTTVRQEVMCLRILLPGVVNGSIYAEFTNGTNTFSIVIEFATTTRTLVSLLSKREDLFTGATSPLSPSTYNCHNRDLRGGEA